MSSGGGYSHRSGPRGGHFRRLSKAAPRSSKNGQSSCADGGSIGPSALCASAIVTGSISAQQLPASRHSPRARPAPAGSERCPMHSRTSVFAALPLPRHAAQAAADLAAKHTAPGGSDLPIEGVPAHASAIRAGALAVFRRFFVRAAIRRIRSRPLLRAFPHSISVSIIPVPGVLQCSRRTIYKYIEMMDG